MVDYMHMVMYDGQEIQIEQIEMVGERKDEERKEKMRMTWRE